MAMKNISNNSTGTALESHPTLTFIDDKKLTTTLQHIES